MPRWLLKTIVGASLAAAVSATGYAMSAVIDYGNRITTLEAHRGDVVERLDRIENKVDRLIEQRGR